MVISETEVFPKGSYDDLTDSTTQALKYLRDNGMLSNREEIRDEEDRKSRYRPKSKALYEV